MKKSIVETTNDIWVFISHSLDDYNQVRRVRDFLEDEGFRPIMFFLKAFEDHPDDEMLKTLLRNEIDSRKRFILCKSRHTDPPKGWVKFEVDYIKGKDAEEFRKHIYQVVDLEQTDEQIKEQIKLFKRNATVYISYSRHDEKLYYFLKKHLEISLDMKVIDIQSSLVFCMDYPKVLKNAIEESLLNGVFIPIITNNSISSPYCYEELKYALSLDPNRVIPFVYTELNHTLPDFSKFQDLIMHRKWIEFCESDMDTPLDILSWHIQHLSNQELF